MKEKGWILRKDYDTEAVKRLQAIGVSRTIAILLAERGITTGEEMEKFFHPAIDHVHDPFLMKDMDKVVGRIQQAQSANQRILVYGDYDTDGTTAVALLFSFLQKNYTNLDFYVPDRYTEGYGISRKGIDYAHDTGVKLIIALDCGIRANEQIAYANQYGIDVIVGDHHLPGDELPRAYAILDPKREGCPYPYKELSGCGIAFKIAEAILEKKYGVRLCDGHLKDTEPYLKLKIDLAQYLDLVVMSIASDIVPINGENRALAYCGLKMINLRPRPGIEAILLYSNIKRETVPNSGHYFCKELTISDLVFLVGPRINAAGRISSARDSVKLLLCNNNAEAKDWAEKINEHNNERKGLDKQVTADATQIIYADEHLQNKKTIVLFSPEWHKGVIGIVASRLIEEFYKPTIIFTKSDDLYTGSARSVKDFDIYSAIDKCSDLLEHFGGHKYAAGVSLRPENFDKFVERFEKVVSETITEEQTTPSIEIDAVVSFAKEIDNTDFLETLKKFAPFGPQNMLPIFQSDNLVDTGDAREVGGEAAKHLKFEVMECDQLSQRYPAIGFQLGRYFNKVKEGAHFNICYHIEENFWQGKTETQLNVKDIHIIGPDDYISAI